MRNTNLSKVAASGGHRLRHSRAHGVCRGPAGATRASTSMTAGAPSLPPRSLLSPAGKAAKGQGRRAQTGCEGEPAAPSFRRAFLADLHTDS